MYRDSRQVHNMNDFTNPWHGIHSTYQFIGYGLTKRDTYPEAPKYLCDSRTMYKPSFM